jgi:predicted dithiol-disulfide oxidoreductase (DUF899 family)
MFFKADEFFKTEVNANASFPLNLSFEVPCDSLPEFQSPGNFFMYYKTELVYIGFFYPGQKNRDVRKERMNKELATITMRGRQVTMNPTSNTALDRSKNLQNVPRTPQGDFVTSKKRVDFADKNWATLKTNDFLNDFQFYWFKEDKKLGRTRNELKTVTDQLIKFYKPTCNGK